MIRINLLPYREEKRKVKRQQFYSLLGLVSILGGLIVFSGYTVIDEYQAVQQSRNDFIKKEVDVLNKEIEDIKLLRENVQAMLARKQVIESLQQDRAESVLLLNEMAKKTPEGVYLSALEQNGLRISLNGYAQSSPRVSAMVRNMRSLEWLDNPQIGEVRSVNLGGKSLSEFRMTVNIKRILDQEAARK
jgi:type IV pilus assembly protein PilN